MDEEDRVEGLERYLTGIDISTPERRMDALSADLNLNGHVTVEEQRALREP